MNTWPDLVHTAVLRHLAGPQQLFDLFRPYSELCQACNNLELFKPLLHIVDLSALPEGCRNRDTVLRLLRRCKGAIERVNLHGLDAIDAATVEDAAHLLAKEPLVALDLGNCPQVTCESLAALGRFPSLEELVLECMSSLDDNHLANLCRSLPRLCRLDVRHCEWLRYAFAFLNDAPQRHWVSLQLDGCFRLDVSALIGAPPGTWEALEELSLDGEDLSNEDFTQLARLCPSLRHLSISFARELEPPALAVLGSMPQLESVILKKASKPMDVHWAALFIEQRRVRPAVGHWKVLNVAECEFFADGAISALATTPQPLLLDVDLSWCWHLTDEGLCALLLAAPNLRLVKLAGVKSLTGRGLIPCCGLPQLAELDCTSCNSISDNILEFLHRLFYARPGCHSEALPREDALPPVVAKAAAALWAKRPPLAARLQVKNYYAEYLENWAQLRPPGEVCAEAERIMLSLGPLGYGAEHALDGPSSPS